MHGVYTRQAESVETFLALRELFSRNCAAQEFGAETLAELLYHERYLDYQVCSCCIEIALEALRDERGEVLA
ncbi:MAG: hypothetical protein AB1425_11140 [Actinomycetota bacterium]